MKKNKKLKLALNKQTIVKLDNNDLNGIKGGDEILSIFHCCTDGSRSCGVETNTSWNCSYVCTYNCY